MRGLKQCLLVSLIGLIFIFVGKIEAANPNGLDSALIADYASHAGVSLNKASQVLKGMHFKTIPPSDLVLPPKVIGLAPPSCNANLNFETGDLTGWVTTGNGKATIVSAATGGTGIDTFGLFPVVGSGKYSLRLGDWYAVDTPYAPTWVYQHCSASNTFSITAAKPVINLQFAFDILSFGHTAQQAAYVQIEMLDANNDTILCTKYRAWDDNTGTGTSGFKTSSKKGKGGQFPGPNKYQLKPVKFLPWQTVNFDLTNYINQNVTLKITNSWCIFNVDWAYSYIDATCAPPNTIVQSDTLCGTTPVQLSAPQGMKKYTWTGPGVVPGDTTYQISTNQPGLYTVKVTNFQGCPNTYNYTLKQAQVTLTPSFSIANTCSNTLNFSNNSSINLGSIAQSKWYFGDGDSLIGANVSNATHTYLKNQSYNVTLTVVSSGGCLSTTNKTVVVSTPPSLSFTTHSASCGNNNGQASAVVTGGSTPYTYNWANNGTVNPLSNISGGTYSITVTDANGCTVNNTIIVPSTPSLAITTGTIQPLTCFGSNDGSISTNITGGVSPFNFAWSNGNKYQNVTSTNTFSNLSSNGYTVTITDANNCTSSTSAMINSPQVINTVPTIVPATCGMSNGSASVVGSGGTNPLNYNWSIVGQSTNAITNVKANAYTLTITDANGCKKIDTLVIPNLSTLQANILPFNNLKCYGDTNGSIIVRAKGGNGKLTYAWSNGSTDSAVVNLRANNYTVTVTDASNCALINTVVLKQPAQLIYPAFGIPLSCANSHDGTALVEPKGGTPPLNALWNNGSTGLALDSVDAGIYKVKITDGNGCVKDTFAVVTAPSPMLVKHTSSDAYCNRASGSASIIQASGGTPGVGGIYTYSWSNGSTQNSINNVFPGTYTIVVTDANKCIIKDTVKVGNLPGVSSTVSLNNPITCYGNCDGKATVNPIGGNAPYRYAWSNGDTLPAASNLCAQYYFITVTDANNCTSKDSILINQPTPFALSAVKPDSACINQQVELKVIPSGGTQGYLLTWNPGGIVADSISIKLGISTTYTVNGTDANNCPAKSVTLFQPIRLPLSAIIFGANSVCGNGHMVPLNSQVTGGDGKYAYSWSTVPQQTTSNISPTVNGTSTYSLTVSDGCGTPVTIVSKTINVSDAPTVMFSADKTSGCPILCVKFSDASVPANGDPISSWDWDFGNTQQSNLKQPDSVCFSTGIYDIRLKVVTASGCTSSDTMKKMITVFPHPIPGFIVNPIQATTLSPNFNFYEQCSPDVTNWFWEFDSQHLGITQTSTSKNPVYTYPDLGTYNPRLVVANADGCKDSITHTIKYVSEYVFYVPDAFSPNNDLVNDVFHGKGVGVMNFNMHIYDRWGQLIFQSNDINIGWDGTVYGTSQIAPQDVYSYIIDIQDIFYTPHQVVGHVTLIR